MKPYFQRILMTVVACLWVLNIVHLASAQQLETAPSVHCGDIARREMTPESPFQDTILSVDAGTKLNLTIQPLGSGFNPVVFLLDPGGGTMLIQNGVAGGFAEELIDYQISSSNATLRIFGAPLDFTDVIPEDNLSTFWMRVQQQIDNPGGEGHLLLVSQYNSVGTFFGAYTISFGCTLLDGTVIEPGDTLAAEQPQPGQPPVAPAFSGVGFPGLAPVDFANAAKLPLPAGIAMSGGITPNGGEILGYTLDAAEGDTLDLTFTRLSGNLNLGLVVLSADNQVVFQASLVTSTTLNTRFTLPSAGQYTIGVFRIDLLPPAAPEATAFQVQGTLNP